MSASKWLKQGLTGQNVGLSLNHGSALRHDLGQSTPARQHGATRTSFRQRMVCSESAVRGNGDDSQIGHLANSASRRVRTRTLIDTGDCWARSIAFGNSTNLHDGATSVESRRVPSTPVWLT